MNSSVASKRSSKNNILFGKGTLETEENLLRDVSYVLEEEKIDYRVEKYAQLNKVMGEQQMHD